MKSKRFKQLFKWMSILSISSLFIFFILNVFFPLREPPPFSVIVTGNDGTMLHAFLSSDEKWRMKAEPNEIVPLIKQTMIFKEDRMFYYHPGVNPFSIARAAITNVIEGRKSSGASTITMQVARLLYPAKRTYLNKTIEIFRSFQLEWKYSKDEIFQLYVNLVPYGGNIEGIKAASWFYFGIQPQYINLSQAVILSVIPNKPGSLHPKHGNYLITAQRDRWLKKMKAGGIISKTETEQATHETIDMPRRHVPGKIPQLAIRLRKNSGDQTSIHTSIDKSIQEKTESIAYNHHQRLELKNIHNLSVLVIENSNRKVRAYLGSPDFFDTMNSGQVDGCDAVRSPGSTLKPLVYAMALDKGIITPATMVEDVPLNFAGYAPENFNSKCNGLVSASHALAFSLNIPAVALLNETGLHDFTANLRKCGFASLKNDNVMGLSVILGGCGVKMTELASMYCAIANGGEYVPISFYEEETSAAPTKLVSDAAAFLVTDMLTQLTRPDLPNNYESSLHLPKIAWKTGTSYGRRDAWSIGYNKKYTIAVWAGNFNGEGVPELTGADIATPLLFDLFNAIDYNSSKSWYLAPKSTDLRLVCSHSGLPPGEFCNDLITDYYLPSVSTNKKCSHAIEINTSANGTFSYCMSCLPDNGYKIMVIDNVPPAVASFYDANNMVYQRPPPHNPDCIQTFDGRAPQILAPVNNKSYLLEKNANQSLTLTCQPGADVNSVFWYINDKFLEKCLPGKSVYFTPSEGSYKISCSDDKGRNNNIFITVKMF